MRILLDGDRSVHSHAPAILTEQKVERATQSTLALPGISRDEERMALEELKSVNVNFLAATAKVALRFEAKAFDDN